MSVWVDGSDKDLAKARDAFYRDGFFFVKNLFPVEDLQAVVEEISETLRYLLSSREIAFGQGDNLDQLYNRAWESLGENRRYLSTLPGDLSSFATLVGHFSVRTMIKRLFETSAVQTVGDSNVLRVDRPGDDSTILTWHQDFPYNVLAEDAATVWAPILPVSSEMGRMRVVRGGLSLRPVGLVRGEKNKFHSSSYFRLSGLERDSSDFQDNSEELPEIGVGDAVVQHSLLLHASGKNRTLENSRWVFTARYADVHRKRSASRLWLTARDKYPFFFASEYPELVEELPSK
jgi:ectoine hydroxylase-related dioxygenase (phytanoyl-CoA dioxygenase family)